MIEESAQVIAVEGDSGEYVWVETQRQSACGGCAANHACGTATLAKVLGRRRTRVRALNHGGAQVGDHVIIALDESALLRGSVALYAVPLAALLAASVIGALLSQRLQIDNESLTIALGIGGLLAGLWWLKGFTQRVRDDRRYQPVVLRRLAG